MMIAAELCGEKRIKDRVEHPHLMRTVTVPLIRVHKPILERVRVCQRE